MTVFYCSRNYIRQKVHILKILKDLLNLNLEFKLNFLFWIFKEFWQMQRSVWLKFITPEIFWIPLPVNLYSHPLTQRKSFFGCFSILAMITVCLFSHHTLVLPVGKWSCSFTHFAVLRVIHVAACTYTCIKPFFPFFCSILLKECGMKYILGDTGLQNLGKSRELIWQEQVVLSPVQRSNKTLLSLDF